MNTQESLPVILSPMNETNRANTDRIKDMARMMKTVSHPNRLAIIELLAERGPLKVKEIIDEISISQSNASQHLKALEVIGVLDSQRDGKCIAYSVRKQGIRQVLSALADCVDC